MTEHSVAVIHRYLDIGGGESVCFHILEALQNTYDVHLYALNRPDFGRLNDAFGTAVRDVTVHTPEVLTSGLSLVDTVIHAATGETGVQPGLQLAMLSRRYARQWREYDVRISTHGELPLSPPALQYIHHPFLNRWTRGGHFEIESTTGNVLNQMYTRLSGATVERVRRSELLTNSEWTADQIELLYEDRPDVVFPPINVDGFRGVPWPERENGFVSIGRISQDKQSHQAMAIVSELRKKGSDVHLHLVGPIDEDTRYGRQIRREATRREWLTIEGHVPKERLYELIEEHRWAIHTKPFEHFGMAIAEQIAGGAVPFVPDSGGQVDIVGRNPRLCYDSIDDAVTKINWCLSDEERTRELRRNLPDVREKFGKERFKNEIRERVAAVI